MSFNSFLTDDPLVSLNNNGFQSVPPSENQPTEQFLDYLSITGLLDSSSDVLSVDNSFLNTDLLETLDTKDINYDHPVIDDFFAMDLPQDDPMITFLSPLTLSLNSNKSSVDPEAVCMGHFPSFGLSEPVKTNVFESGYTDLPEPMQTNVFDPAQTDLSEPLQANLSEPVHTDPFEPMQIDLSKEVPKKDSSIELPSVLWDATVEKEPQQTAMEVEPTNDLTVPTIIPDLFPLPMNSPYSCDDDSANEEYSMEIEAERDSCEKKNHTWEETATQLQLPISTTEMSQYVIPDHWLTADEYQQLLFDMERGNGMYPLYDLGIDNHQVTYHPNFIYINPCPAIYFLRCEFLKNGRPMFGFPRIKNVSKQYTWKKQGFTTAIPKSNPTVRYITANCYLCGKGKNRVIQICPMNK